MRRQTVSIIVDPSFGDRLDDIAVRGPVWIADTALNRAAAERSWHVHPQRDVTTFLVDPTQSPDQWAIGILATVAEHFGAYDGSRASYDVVEVIGVTPTAGLRASLAEGGYSQFEEAAGSFRASHCDGAV